MLNQAGANCTSTLLKLEESLAKKAIGKKNFLNYVCKDNKTYCITILASALLQFIFFKFLYPFPDFFADSYSYINAAALNLKINIYPIGYSGFLYLFHLITKSATALVFFQYFAYSLASFYFYFSITYFYITRRVTRITLSIFLFFNPIFLYLANYITGDIILIAVSLAWFTELIWILNRPRLGHVVKQAVLILCIFAFRYNSVIYLVATALAFLLSNQKIWIKALGIVSPLFLILLFVAWSSNSAKEITGRAQYPPIMVGWQWASKALYMRPLINEDTNAFPKPEEAEVDRIARKFIVDYRPQDMMNSYVGNLYIRQHEAPLKQYLFKHFIAKTAAENVAAWGKAGVIFGEYGKFLIWRHPLSFLRYYLLLNTKYYFLPPLDKLEIYNVGMNVMRPLGEDWFHYKSPKVWCISKDLQGKVLMLFPVFFTTLNLYYIFTLFMIAHRVSLKKIHKAINCTIILTTIFLLLNAMSSIFDDIIVIRYQIFPMLLLLAFAMMLTDNLQLLRRSD